MSRMSMVTILRSKELGISIFTADLAQPALKIRQVNWDGDQIEGWFQPTARPKGFLLPGPSMGRKPQLLPLGVP